MGVRGPPVGRRKTVRNVTERAPDTMEACQVALALIAAHLREDEEAVTALLTPEEHPHALAQAVSKLAAAIVLQASGDTAVALANVRRMQRRLLGQDAAP